MWEFIGKIPVCRCNVADFLMADVIRTYVSANRHDVIRTYGHFGYNRQMTTLYDTDNKSN